MNIILESSELSLNQLVPIVFGTRSVPVKFGGSSMFKTALGQCFHFCVIIFAVCSGVVCLSGIRYLLRFGRLICLTRTSSPTGRARRSILRCELIYLNLLIREPSYKPNGNCTSGIV